MNEWQQNTNGTQYQSQQNAGAGQFQSRQNASGDVFQRQQGAPGNPNGKKSGSGGGRKGGGIVSVILAIIVFAVARTLVSGALSPKPTPTPVQIDIPMSRNFLIEKDADMWHVEVVHYGGSTKTLKSIEHVIAFSKDSFLLADIEAIEDEKWDEVIPGLSTYSFATREITESDDAITVRITLNDLDDSRNLSALAEGGYGTWEGGDGDVASADEYMESLRSHGAEDLGMLMPTTFS